VPNGWSVDRQISTTEGVGPSEDDLMAIADAVREVARTHQETTGNSQMIENQSIGRRGHLRAVPS